MKSTNGFKSASKLEEFARALAEICSRSPVAAAGGPPPGLLRWTIIANPCAGGFTINSHWKRHRALLKTLAETVKNNTPKQDAAPSQTARSGGTGAGTPSAGGGGTEVLGRCGLIATTGPGHAAAITKDLLKEAEESGAGKTGDAPPFYLIITAGGDGTSLEVLQTLYLARLDDPAALSRFAVLRLPMGTGNDGADAFELDRALELLIKPVRIELSRGLKLSTGTGKTWPSGNPFLAFNILSIGLDAFVTHMTNKMKGRLPGDSYKLWVDIASLLYDKLYTVGPMKITGYDKRGREMISLNEKILLCAMGISGRRSYGSRKMILPDDRNVCAVKQMSLFRKLALKGLFSTGAHADKPESVLWNASRIVVSAAHPILIQMDGEAAPLAPEDFPVTIELTDPVIPVLRGSPESSALVGAS